MPIPPPTTRRVLTTDLACTDYNGLGEFLKSRAATGNLPAYAVDFTNTHIATMRRHDPAFARVTSSIDLFVPDGMPLVWCLNLQGAGLQDRIYGPTFMRKFLESCPPDFSHYFLGGSENCIEKLVKNLKASNPDLNIAGARDGYFKNAREIIGDIESKKPDFLWLGLGTPKQQAFIQKWKPQLGAKVILAIGFGFDVNAGTKPDAPGWMQRNGLTWIHRLMDEPNRLFYRYLKWNFLFIIYQIRLFLKIQ